MPSMYDLISFLLKIGSDGWSVRLSDCQTIGLTIEQSDSRIVRWTLAPYSWGTIGSEHETNQILKLQKYELAKNRPLSFNCNEN